MTAGTGLAAAPEFELAGVTAAYGRTVALRDLSLTVAPGSVVALLGANGAGKTTTMRVASGLLRTMSGSVRLGADDITSVSAAGRAARGVCLIPEGRGIFRSLTVRENLELQVPGRATEKAIAPAFDAFPKLASRTSQIAGSLSGGEQQMLALSRAFLCSPRIVLLDEISLGLAPIVVDELFASLRALADTGASIVIVEQYVGRALSMADEAYVLSRGALSWHGPAAKLDLSEITRNYLGSDTPASPAAIPQAEWQREARSEEAPPDGEYPTSREAP